jgi:hypothetical protein
MTSTITDRLNGITTSVAVKPACVCATTANITLSGLQTIDGITVTAGQRVLVKDQTSSIDNGIYLAQTDDWTRATDFDGSLDVVGGTLVYTSSGLSQENTFWVVSGYGELSPGTDAITFTSPVFIAPEWPSTVKGYSAVGDGITSDQDAVVAAVAACYASGADLYWPEGTYLTTATIPHLHDVRHRGPGVIKRGSDLFYPDIKGTQTNKIYVATTGSASNDGLSSSQPISSLNYANVNVLEKYGPYLEGTWQVYVAAGTYTDRTIFYVQSRNQIEVIGPTVTTSSGTIKLHTGSKTGTYQVGEALTGGTSFAVATITNVDENILTATVVSGTFQSGETITGGTSGATSTCSFVRAVPTVKFNGASSLSNCISLQRFTRVKMSYVWATAATDNTIEAFEMADLELYACHSTNSAATGSSSGSCLYVANGAIFLANGPCLFDNCNSASEGVVLLYGAGSTGTLGRTGTSVDDSPAICRGQRGTQIQHHGLMKQRYAYIYDCTYGSYADGGRTSHEHGAVNGCELAYYSGSFGMLDIVYQSVDHPTGVVISNCVNLRYHGETPGVPTRPLQVDDAGWTRVGLYAAADLTNPTITGTTSATNILTEALELLSRDFGRMGRAFKIVVKGNMAGVSGTKSFALVGSASGSLRTVVTVSGATGDFICELTLTVLADCASASTNTVSFLGEGRIERDNELGEYVSATGSDDLQLTQTIAVTGQLSSAGDTISVDAVEVWQMGI